MLPSCDCAAQTWLWRYRSKTTFTWNLPDRHPSTLGSAFHPAHPYPGAAPFSIRVPLLLGLWGGAFKALDNLMSSVCTCSKVARPALACSFEHIILIEHNSTSCQEGFKYLQLTRPAINPPKSKPCTLPGFANWRSASNDSLRAAGEEAWVLPAACSMPPPKL